MKWRATSRAASSTRCCRSKASSKGAWISSTVEGKSLNRSSPYSASSSWSEQLFIADFEAVLYHGGFFADLATRLRELAKACRAQGCSVVAPGALIRHIEPHGLKVVEIPPWFDPAETRFTPSRAARRLGRMAFLLAAVAMFGGGVFSQFWPEALSASFQPFERLTAFTSVKAPYKLRCTFPLGLQAFGRSRPAAKAWS